MPLLHYENPVCPSNVTRRDADSSTFICASRSDVIVLHFLVNLFGSGASQPVLTANEENFSFRLVRYHYYYLGSFLKVQLILYCTLELLISCSYSVQPESRIKAHALALLFVASDEALVCT